MITRTKIEKYLKELNDLLKIDDVKGEICLYGGTVMCLVFNARPATRDIDAVFKPSGIIREAALKIAIKNHLKSDWLNDGVKGFVVRHKQKVLFDWPNLKVYYPEPEYMLAMKAISSRVDTKDKDDIQFLIKKLGVKTADDVFNVIGKYYPNNRIKPAVQYFIEELFQK